MEKRKAIVMTSYGNIGDVYNSDTCDILNKYLEFLPPLQNFDDETLKERESDLAEVEFIFSTWGMPSFDEKFISEKLPALKAVFYGAGSVQYFARPFLNLGITVVSAWAANSVPVAEFTVAQIILAGKGYFQRFKKTSCTKWDRRDVKIEIRGNYGIKIGIIGAGMIGRAVIKMLHSYKCEIYVFDPFLSDETAEELGVTKTSLDVIFSECQVISNHLANNQQTVGMLNGRLFSMMKPNAVFINTGRGAQVVESDLCAALRECPERVALLDVTDPEPPVEGSELFELDNVYLSPHIAGSIGDEIARMGEYVADEFVAYIENRPLKYSVTLKMLETMA